jgi:hypothetical protein
MLKTDKKQSAQLAIQNSHQTLRGEKDLSPRNEKVTHTLTHLVKTLTQCTSKNISGYLLSTPDLKVERDELPNLCGMAEGEMEKYWARKLISETGLELSSFWYYSQYCELCQAETELFKQRTFKKISFLGSGALPVTAIMMARQLPQSKIICVDFDAEACDLSEQLCKKMNVEKQIDIRCMDALQYQPEHDELVVCASLLQGRDQVYQRLKSLDCGLIVRDAEGPYQYLYKPAELPKENYRQIARTKMDSRRINTSRYFELETGYVADNFKTKAA